MATPGDDVNVQADMLRAMRESRYRLLEIDEDVLFQVLQRLAPSIRNLHQLGIHYDHQQRCWQIRVAHPRFEPVCCGEMLPIMRVELVNREPVQTPAENSPPSYVELSTTNF